MHCTNTANSNQFDFQSLFSQHSHKYDTFIYYSVIASMFSCCCLFFQEAMHPTLSYLAHVRDRNPAASLQLTVFNGVNTALTRRH